MRTIKSFWTKPAGAFYEGLEELASWSILSAIKHAGRVEIFTDNKGAEWVKALRLPIPPQDITCELEHAPGDGFTWNEGKLYCNLIQRTPFIQTDLDVIMGRDWARRIKTASLVGERRYYFAHSWAEGLMMPDHWRRAINAEDGRSIACGSFGGNDIPAIQRIATLGLKFISDNREKLKEKRPLLGCLCAEEWAVIREYDWNEISTIVPDSIPLAGQFCQPEKSYLHRQGAVKRTEKGIASTRERLEAILPGQGRRCAEVRKAFAKSIG